MKAVKLFFISVIVLFLLMSAISALIPSNVRISRAIDISASEQEIHRQIDSMATWQNWNAFIINMEEKELYKDSILGDNLQVRMVQRTPEQVITTWNEVKKNKSFTGGFNFMNHGSVITVQWYFDFHFGWYPWEKFSSIVYDEQLGPAMQESLNNLKTLTEHIHE